MTKSDYEVEDTSGAALAASADGLRRFTEGGIGLSAHWGLYALSTRDTEWIYYNERIGYQTYRRRMAQFNPTRFCAAEWADLMVEAGMKFFVITSKHHDGFCLWDADGTDFKVTNTAFKRDILDELSEALHERQIGLHFYYSLVDWTHRSYRSDWPAYVAYYQGQVRELCRRFAPAGFAFDGYWPRFPLEEDGMAEYFAAGGAWDLAGTYDLIHELCPDAVVANNSHVPPLRGEDYQLWELDLPGENTIGFNCTEVGDKATASWWNLNAGWSYQPWHHAVKSAEEIFATYQTVRSRGAVFILNVGPRPFGDIHPQEQQVLREIGGRLGGVNRC
ncbi:MAG: alpha-L-fucosidase [Planctomycetaceae bacterium]|nr:alpha-L-fucosidase [Planctomycetaceae bacterium]